MATTIKVSEATRDRIKALGGSTHEDTIIAALDALEDVEFWTQAERAKTWLEAHPDVQAAVDAEVTEWDAQVAAIR